MVVSKEQLQKQTSDTKKPTPKGNEVLVPVYRVKLGDNVYDSSKGEMLVDKYPPYVWMSTRRYSEARFVLDDPDAKIYKSIEEKQEIQVELGFTNGKIINKFIGQIYKYGRVLPRGSLILALDKSAALNTQVGPSTMKTANETTTQSAPESGGQVVSSFTGEASFYGNNDGFDGKPTASGEKFNARDLTAAHKTLPFNTKVRVTNPKNNKSVVVRINDRGPYSGGRVIDLSVAAAEALDMIAAGHAQVKGEVLSSTATGVVPTPKQSTSPAPTASGSAAQSNESSNATLQMFQLSDKASLIKTAELSITNITDSSKSLKFAKDTDYINISEGTARLQRSQPQVESIEAALRGDVIVTRGNTVREVSPDKVSATNIVLDYKTNPSVFLGYPTITRRTALQIQSGLGSTTIQGYNINEKQSIAVTAVTPVEPTPVASGSIAVPEWGQLKMSDPIFPGCVYTWGDATKGGRRVPASKQVMEGIVKIAQAIAPFTEKTVGKGKKWNIHSWYRDPAANSACGGASRSRHLVGDAVDFSFPGYMSLWPELQKTWSGGYAIKPGSFIHLDCGPKRTWVYG